MKPATLFATVTFLSAIVAHAEEMPASSPSPDVKKLARLAGNWRGTGTFTSEGKKTPFTWQMSCTQAAQGYGVYCRFGARGIPIIPRYEGSSIVGWDKVRWRAPELTLGHAERVRRLAASVENARDEPLGPEPACVGGAAPFARLDLELDSFAGHTGGEV